MKLKLRKFLEGGPMPAEDPAMEGGVPMEEGGAPEAGGGDPMMQLAEMFMQGLLNQDCELLAQGAEMFLLMVLQAQGGGAPPEGEPVYRKGGKLAYRIKN